MDGLMDYIYLELYNKSAFKVGKFPIVQNLSETITLDVFPIYLSELAQSW